MRTPCHNEMLCSICRDGKRTSVVLLAQSSHPRAAHLSAILLRVIRFRGVLLMASVISDDQPCTDSRQSRLHSSGSVTRSSCTPGHLTRRCTHSLTAQALKMPAHRAAYEPSHLRFTAKVCKERCCSKSSKIHCLTATHSLKLSSCERQISAGQASATELRTEEQFLVVNQ